MANLDLGPDVAGELYCKTHAKNTGHHLPEKTVQAAKRKIIERLSN